jgi:hypothetical protein
MPVLLAAATMAPPEEPLAGQLRGALWHDLRLNGMIYNGSALASLWYNAGGEDENAPQLHIRNMACRANALGHRCAFTLWREGGARMVRDELAPDTIACTAQFVRDDRDGGWMVKHRLTPRGGGHSRTDLRCKTARA